MTQHHRTNTPTGKQTTTYDKKPQVTTEKPTTAALSGVAQERVEAVEGRVDGVAGGALEWQDSSPG